MSAVLAWPSPSEPWEARELRARRLTRRDWEEAWESIGRLERDARLLRRSMPQSAANDAARAARLRRELATPVDTWWAARNAAQHRLHVALRIAARSRQWTRKALRVARGETA